MSFSLRTIILNRIRLLLKFYPLDALLAYFTRRFDSLAILRKILPNNYQYKKGTWRVVERDGIRFNVDLNDFIDWKLYFCTWSKDRKILFSKINSGDVVYDIGTHKGAVLLYLAHKVGTNGSVVGFEAFPATYDFCKRNVELNPTMTQVQLFHLAIGDRNTNISMEKPANTNTSGNRIAIVDNAEVQKNIVESSLDIFLSQHPNIKMPNFIKIMTNGYELHGLRGAKNTILKYKPILFLELGEDNLRAQGDSGKTMLKFLEECDYISYKVLTNEKISSSDDFTNMVFDLISYPKS